MLCDPTQIHEIVMNLCANAAHSMKNEKGLLQVLYEEIAFEKEIQGRAGTVAPGMYSVITVRDNGRGMDSDTLERIFEPFFTTKSQGEGTGMGLAVVFGIVQSHGGTITAESMLGKGSTFRVYLPKSEKQHDGELINDNTPVQRGTERILFIDDEEAISEMVKDILTNLGYVVTVFNEPLRAVEAFADGPDQFDLVITDQTMPGLTGMELVHRIREIKSDVSIILSTGYSRLIDEEKALAAGIDGFLSKPFRRRIIAHKIREVLERRNNL
ncbi:MAG: ATP-binding protein [Chitinivibrionales bacterium]